VQPNLEVVLLIWLNEKDYFGERDNADSTRSDQQAPFLYKANSELLIQMGLKVPQLYYFDSTYHHVPFCYAMVEYLSASPFNEWKKDRSPQEIPPLLGKVRSYLQQMHAIQRDRYGTIFETTARPMPCYEQTLRDTYSESDDLAGAFERVRQAQSNIREKLEILYHRILPRNTYSFIHDELGLDEHLLIDAQGEIVIIDLDGCHFFDIEREHSYLKLRFGELYKYLKRDDLDPARMQFYGLCLHISAAHGHHQLLLKGFPDAPILKEIVEWNIQQLLTFSIDSSIQGFLD